MKPQALNYSICIEPVQRARLLGVDFNSPQGPRLVLRRVLNSLAVLAGMILMPVLCGFCTGSAHPRNYSRFCPELHGGTVFCSGFHEAKYDFRAIQNYSENKGMRWVLQDKQGTPESVFQRMSSSASRNSWGVRGPQTRASST